MLSNWTGDMDWTGRRHHNWGAGHELSRMWDQWGSNQWQQFPRMNVSETNDMIQVEAEVYLLDSTFFDY